ncbi:hypothetical protein BGW37DRAFT_451766, partial [Umbelopsis sp. PMI_123]
MKSSTTLTPIPQNTPISPSSITSLGAKESLDKVLPWIYETSWHKQIPNSTVLLLTTSDANVTIPSAPLSVGEFQDLLRARIQFQQIHIQEPRTTHRLAELLSIYHECVKDTMELQVTIKKLQSQAQDRAKRLWLVDNKSRSLQAKCGDGVEITHTFHFNEGQFQVAECAKLSKLLFKLRSEADTLLYRKLYESKMARIQVQQYIDRFCWELQSLRNSSASDRPLLSDNVSELFDFQQLFDILFHYERFFTHLHYAESSIGDNYIAGSHIFSTAPITILEDIRGWIIQLFVLYTSCCNFTDGRFLFHHLITCPGIESWGKNLVMYLLASEQSQQVEIEITAMVQILSIASNLNGLPKHTVEDDETSKINATILTEDDISAILDQLSIPEHLNDCVTRSLTKVKASQQGDPIEDILLHPLSLANDYFQSSSQMLLQFSKTRYTVIVKRLAQMICQLSQNVGRLANGHSDLNITSEVADNIQERVDNLATNVFHCYLGLPRIGVQHFLASIPVQFVSVDGLWKIITDIFHVIPNSSVKYPAKAYSIDHFCKFLLDNNDEGIFFLQYLGINFAKYILENINYGYTTEVESQPHSRTKPWEKRHLPHLSYAIHSEVAFMILGIAQRIQPTADMFEKAAPSTESLTSTIAPYIPSASGVFLSATDANKRKFMDWCWNIVLRLQLFECPINYRATELDDAITNIGIGDHAKLSNDLTASHLCLFTYVAFMLSPTSRHFLRFDINRGWEKVQVMLRSGHGDALIYMFANVVPVFVYMHGDDFFNHGSTLWLLDQILNSKSDPSLNGLELVIASHAWMAKEIDKAFSLVEDDGGFSYLDLVLHSWIKTICSQPDWMWKPSRIALVDYCAKITFSNRRYKLVPSMLQMEVQRLDDIRQSAASPTSSSKSGHEGSRSPMRFMKSVLADTTYPSLLTGEWSMVSLASASLFKTPNVENHSFYFAFHMLVLETIAETDARMQIASINLRKPVDFLSIYRWAQHIMIVPADHNLLPLFLQMFFSLYFSRLTSDDEKNEFLYGHLFFSKKDSLLDGVRKRLVQLKDSQSGSMNAIKENSSTDESRKNRRRDLQQVYHAMWLWLGDARLQKDMKDISELPKPYQSFRLLQCRDFGTSLSKESVKELDFYDGTNIWIDLVDSAQMIKEFEQCQWVSKVVPYQAPGATSRPSSSMAVRSHTPVPTVQSVTAKLPDFKLRKP